MADGRYKLLVGKIRQAGWCGQVHPNISTTWNSFETIENCSYPGKLGCLFDVLNDEGEHHDLSLEMPEKAQEIYDKMLRAEKKFYNPNRGDPDPRACDIAESTGFWQPYLP